MKKMLCLLMLVAGIKGTTFAQNTNSDKVFDLSNDFAKRKFTVDIGKGNRMEILLDYFSDIDRFQNMDSIIKVFLKDIEPLKDSLSDELKTKRIDYVSDSSNVKKIRIQLFNPKGSSFAVSGADVSALKLEQDTINFNGTVSFIAKYTLRKGFRTTRNYKLILYLNNVSDLASYENGSLNEKIKTIRENVNSGYENAGYNNMVLRADKSISVRKPKGFVAGGDYLNFKATVDLANYKAFFVPSFSLGAGVILSNLGFFKREIFLSWDPNFFFAKNAQGQLKTFRNDFVTFTWGQGPIKDFEPRKESSLLFVASLGYLIHRDGEYFDKRTLRLGMGRLSLFEGKTKIEPVMYFHDLFKGLTPGIRLMQSF